MLLKRKPKDPKNEKYWTEEDEVFSFEYEPDRVLYSNDFEQDLDGWYARTPLPEHYDYNNYKVVVEKTDEEAHSGSHCMKVYGRRESWNGAALDITKYLKPGVFNYEVMVWVKLRPDANPARIRIMSEMYEVGCSIDFPNFEVFDDYCDYRGVLSKFRLPVGSGEDDWDTRYPPNYATSDGWVLLRGKKEINASRYSAVMVYLETYKETNSEENTDVDVNDIYIDDFVLLTGK
ncbi:MAG: carbohydrate binding domain-containing protein [Oscillospiraceae bacterium]|nr:carbohydrate binding domain-containing protein [Oscillospiraceae bacterium]